VQQINRWLVVRVGITALSFVTGLQGSAFALNPTAPTDIAWRVFGIVFAVVLIGGFCGIGGAYQTEGVTTGWTKPSWYENPFGRSQTLQLIHFVAISAISEGVGDMLRGLVKVHYDRIPPPSIPLGIGLGLWIALRLAVMIFHSKTDSR